MQFQVPQFIDIEPKIIGPLTLKQFLFLAGAAAPIFILFFVLQFWLWLILAVIFTAAAAALAFVKYNGQPATKIIIAAFHYFWQPRMYLWKREEEKLKLPGIRELEPAKLKRPPLKDLLLKITTTTHPIEKREKPSRFLSFGRIAKESLESFKKTTGERETAKRVDYR